MSKRTIFALCFLLACRFTAHGVEDVVRAVGRGVSDKEAVQDALINAIAQHDGVSIDVATKLSVAQQDVAITINDKSDAFGKMEASTARDTVQKTKGHVLRYDVVRCDKEDDARWIAELDVVFHRYETPGIDPNNRRKLVVAPFATMVAAYSVGAQNVSARATADKFRGKLETFLVQSRRFTILGRQDSDAILAEKNLILRESAEIDEYAKIGAALGTDYLVCGKIADVTVVKGQTQSLFGETSAPKILRARIALDYRILVMPTGQVKWADEVSVDLDADECKALRGDEAAAYDALVDAAARAVCAQALGNIYPVRAARVLDNGEVVLNQGGTLHWEGEMLDAYRLGEVIVDAYNHESLGREESRIALLQVVRVEAKLSYARVIEGEVPAEVVAENRVLCRPTRAVLVETAKPEPSAPSSGVKLPFD